MDTIPVFRRSAKEPAPIDPFRFFDLPAELRVKVYEELFTIRPSKKDSIQISRHSQILRACKKCYNEGQPVLERLNKIRIKVSAFTLIDGSPGDHTFTAIVLRFAGAFRQICGTPSETCRFLRAPATTCISVGSTLYGPAVVAAG